MREYARDSGTAKRRINERVIKVDASLTEERVVRFTPGSATFALAFVDGESVLVGLVFNMDVSGRGRFFCEIPGHIPHSTRILLVLESSDILVVSGRFVEHHALNTSHT